MLSRTTICKTPLAATVFAVAFFQAGLAQVPPASILRIDTTNLVLYYDDTPDASRFATDPNVTTPITTRNFTRNITIADITAVNGQHVTGTHVRGTIANLGLNPAAGPGQAIADTVRGAVAVVTFEILKSDGTPIGTIFGNALVAGPAPPGSPSSVSGANLVITGGTGAFLGVRGQMGTVNPPPGVVAARSASMTEDPANRRRNGGGTIQWIVHLIPMERPEIVMVQAGRAITHSSDFSLVSASNPATPGELLSLFATGLGPVVPGVDPGKPFPSSPLASVNSPVEVTVNGKAAEVLSATGYPGSVDAYQVNFRVPPDTAKGPASIQVTAAWISGTPVSILVE